MQIDTASISIMFSVRSVFYSLGAVSLGCLFNKWNRQILFAMCMLIIAISFVLIPIIPKYDLFLKLACATGYALGGVDTAANVLILEMWGKDSNAYLQALHLCFALGTVFGPLMCTPFISQESISSQLQRESKILIPYAITAAIALLSATMLFGFEVLKPYKPPKRSSTTISSKQSATKNRLRNDAINSESVPLIRTSQGTPQCYYFLVVTLASLVIFMLLCGEHTFFIFLPTFLQKIKVEKIDSLFMSAVFGGSFTLFRFLIQ
ncbi:sodium-dependent glucose transporter 1-like protein [Leptotrombidium deliense]|uniref:Sodium-dependent glucose transporter 1-like protein n=1 Tax=Leptotrombidium deliense TaxID=299467 RepID=A0A443RYA3_9ACAR|nr:sodium-dependent glucose transporter 1-like protein [Leptotrombidium deliense]